MKNFIEDIKERFYNYKCTIHVFDDVSVKPLVERFTSVENKLNDKEYIKLADNYVAAYDYAEV